jgi:hypothetical protein
VHFSIASSTPVTSPAPGQAMEYILRLNQLPQFLTTLYQQDIESGQEQVSLLVEAWVVTGRGVRVGRGMSI